MCGWVGVFGTAEPEAALRAAAATLGSRGPDGAGERVVADGALRAGIAHRRLAILDPSLSGAQPMHDAERRVSVVYNGEIYNSPALRRELEAKGARFRSGTDTEVLLLGWAEWGDEVLRRIEGIFSFALLDEAQGAVLLARDRMGVKPLYWAELDGTIVAASAPRAILSLRPRLGGSLDRTALAQFLTLLWIPHPRTPWTAIKKLPPATALSIRNGRVRQWRYWSPPEPARETAPSIELRRRLEVATERQLLSDVPVGLLLSGGLDSTLLLELMAPHFRGRRLHAVTAGYDRAAQRLEIAPDDMAYAAMAAAGHPEVDLTPVVIDSDPGADLDALAPHFDDPVADPAAVTLYRLCRASATKVLLSGVGGEELFAGYPRHEALRVARTAARLPTAGRRALGRVSPFLLGGRPGALYGPRRNAQKLARAVADRRAPHYWRTMAQLTFEEADRLAPGGAEAAWDDLDARSTPLAVTSMADALAFDRAQFLPNLNLGYVDRAAMAASVEVRVPLLDEAVVSAACALDPASLLAGGATKAPLRDAARGLVPSAVLERDKSGFGSPVRAWVRGRGAAELGERIEALADAGLVEREPARRLLATASGGVADLALAAWALASLQAWHAAYGAAPADPASTPIAVARGIAEAAPAVEAERRAGS